MKKEARNAIITVLSLAGLGTAGYLWHKHNKKKILETGEGTTISLPKVGGGDAPAKDVVVPLPPEVPAPEKTHLIVSDWNGEGIYKSTAPLRDYLTWNGRDKITSLDQYEYVGWLTGRDQHNMYEVNYQTGPNRSRAFWVHKTSVERLKGDMALQEHFRKHPEAKPTDARKQEIEKAFAG